MKKRTNLITLSILILICSACRKGGTGGDATVVVFMKHHGNVIKNHHGYPDTVFVKFNSKELPGTTPDKFDTYFVGEAGEDHIHCENLKAGTYFFYGVGIDSSGPYRVTGGMAVKIKWSERKKEIDTDLAVTE
jgi:hypothetical protein